MLTFQEQPRDSPERPLIIAGLFACTAFASHLEAAAEGVCTLERCDDRARLLHTTTAKHPLALLLPVVDRHDRPTTPLVVTCRRRIPEVSVVLLVGRSRPRGVNVVAALRAGARVAAPDSPDELRAVLQTVLQELEPFSNCRPE
jgi:hypothetical protein